jgi:hypothetical protein
VIASALDTFPPHRPDNGRLPTRQFRLHRIVGQLGGGVRFVRGIRTDAQAHQ